MAPADDALAGHPGRDQLERHHPRRDTPPLGAGGTLTAPATGLESRTAPAARRPRRDEPLVDVPVPVNVDVPETPPRYRR